MLSIGRVAKQVGVQPSAIRYYDRHGLLRPSSRRSNGYRVYNDHAVRMLLFVKRAQALGMTLNEIKPLLDLIGQSKQPCARVKELARKHARETEQKIRELQALRNALRGLLRRKISDSRGAELCPLIERNQRVNRD